MFSWYHCNVQKAVIFNGELLKNQKGVHLMKDLLIGLLVGFLLGSYMTGSVALGELDSLDLRGIVNALGRIEGAINMIP